MWRLFPGRVATFCIVELQKLRHDRTEVFTRALQPVLWLLIFGETFNRLHAIPTGDVPYLDFLAPGIIAQSGLFVAIFYGIMIIWERIERLRAETGMTVLLTTHYMDEADTLCDRIALMHRARLRALGTPDGLKADLGPEATLEDVFRHHTGDTLEAGGDMRHVRQTRRTASRLG